MHVRHVKQRVVRRARYCYHGEARVLSAHEDESVHQLQEGGFFLTKNVRRVPEIALNITHP